jgi:hypothetical protein
MPQNWWEAFPEVVPSPAARPRPLPGPGGVIPGPAMGGQPAFPYSASGLAQLPPNGFDPSFLSGGVALGNSFAQGPYFSPAGQPAINNDAAIGQGGAAVPAEAAGRARMAQVGDGQTGLTASQRFYRYPSAEPGLGPEFGPAIGTDYRNGPQGQQDLLAIGARGDKDSALPDVKSGVSAKPNPPDPLPHYPGRVSAPHTGGARDQAQPRRSYLVPLSPPPGGLNGWGYVPLPGDVQLLARAIYSETGNIRGTCAQSAGRSSIASGFDGGSRFRSAQPCPTSSTSPPGAIINTLF